MKFILPFYLLYTFLSQIEAQPAIEWQRALGGTASETLWCINQTSDGGFITAGFTTSNDGDVSGNHGGGDCWVVKLSQTGQVEWQKCLGGTSTENASSIFQTSDDGYIMAGKTHSEDGDVSGNHGNWDYWVVKLNSTGSIEWQKTLGGTGEEYGFSIQQTMDGGSIMAGFSGSTDGDVSGNHGYADYWVVKLSSTGDIQWQKSLGGSNGAEQAFFIRATSDGGYVVVGNGGSTDGDISDSQGGTDFWVVKLSSLGDIEWERSLGGNAGDAARSVIQAADGGYVVVGEVGSNNTGQVTNNHGLYDYWVVKLSSEGDLEWQKTLGGSDSDWARSVCQAPDGGFVVPGQTYSTDGDAEGCDGADILVIKLSPLGEIEWKKILGGSAGDGVNSIVRTADGGYILAGETYSNDGDVSGNHGGRDAWVVKLSPETTRTKEAPQPALDISPNPVSQSISLHIDSDETNLSLSVFDITGREITRIYNCEGKEIDISKLSNGLYLLKAVTPSGMIYTGKFVKE